MNNISNLRLYHYYDTSVGPFVNLSDLSIKEAERVQNNIRELGKGFASKRNDEYILRRCKLEKLARKEFIKKGGRPQREVPHYMTLGPCEWLMEWYESPKVYVIDIESLPIDSISFTYGDLFPTMGYEDGKPYRKQVYTFNEIMDVVHEYGYPQEWNKDGRHGPERYIEAQVWVDIN